MLWPEPSSALPASVCTWARRKSGTKEGWSQSTFTRWARTRGSLQESWCWALPSGLNSSSARNSKTASIRRGDYGRRSPTYPIFSVVGRSCCRAPTQEPTTHCHALLDACGHHRASCPRSTEHTVARIFREAGAIVRKNVFVKDMNVEVGAEDARQIEVLAQDLPCFGRGAARRGRDVALCVELRRRGSPTRSRHTANWLSWPSKQAGAGAMKLRR